MTAAYSTGGSSTTSGLPHPHRHALDREAREQLVRERGRERLEQVVRAPVGDLAHAGGDIAVVDGVLEPVGAARFAHVQLDVEEEALALLALPVERAVPAVQLDPVQLDLHAIAPAAASASTWSRTSWTRKIDAPRS